MTTCQIQVNYLATNRPRLQAALVRFQMQNILCKTQGAYPMLKCEEDFGLGRSAFERIISGIKRAGGHEYKRLRTMGSNEQPTSMTRQKGKRAEPYGQRTNRFGIRYGPPVVSFVKRCVHWNPV